MSSALIFDPMSCARAEEIARRFHPSVLRHYDSCAPASNDCFDLPDLGFNSVVPSLGGNDTAVSNSDLYGLGNIFAAQCTIESCRQ
jgi:hypothetical protein